MQQPLVSIIIPNWNGSEHLPRCVEALHRQTWQNVRVLVVDNASSDGSIDLLQTQYPWVEVIELPDNRGFTGACNVGLKASTESDIAILLNNDTEVKDDWVEQVLAAFQRHPKAGIVASKMLLFDQRHRLHTAGDFLRIDGRPGNRGVWQDDGPAYDEEIEIFSACGGSSAYRQTMLRDIGLLDDDFFFSMEDVDLAWRAQLAGWQSVYAPKAVVYHKLKATGGGVTASYYDGRNLIWTIAKNYPGSLLRKHWQVIFAGQWRLAVDAAKAWRGEAARARLRGMLAGLFGLPKMLRKRREIQAKKTVRDDSIQRLLKPVDYEGVD